MHLHAYQSQMEQWEHQYQQDLLRFKQNLLTNHSPNRGITLYNSLLVYLNHRTNRMEQEMFYEKVPIYRRKLVRFLRRNLKSMKNRVSVFPLIILDVSFNPFTTRELKYLSRG